MINDNDYLSQEKQENSITPSSLVSTKKNRYMRLKDKVFQLSRNLGIITKLKQLRKPEFDKMNFMPRKRRRPRSYNQNWWSVFGRKVRNSRRVARFRAGLREAKLLNFLAISSFVLVILGSLSITVLFAWYSRDLPNPNQIIRREGFSTKIYDRHGELLYDVFGDENRVPISIDEIPEHLKQAVVAIEDKDFYTHEGFDLFGMARGFSRLFTRGRAQGGSTLTQQLVKNSLLSSERRLSRKIKEFVLAVQIERRFSKDEILQMYLNEVPYGGTAWGVGTAAETYFNKSVSELDLVEAAILAGLPQRPSVYSPFGPTPDAYIGRTTNVLRRMREDGFITKEEEEAAVSALPDIEFARPGSSIKAPHFVFYVISQLEEMYGQDMVQNGGLRVNTTLDLEIHQEAQQIVSEEIEQVSDLNIGNGAALVMDPNTGEIISMIGSKDYYAEDYDGQVNVTLSLRQPGSAIKPVTYAAAFERGYTPATMLMDTKTEFPGGAGNPPYIPVNYDGTYRGPVQLRASLASSLNVTAVKLLALVGIEDMLKLAYNMGLTTLEPTPENLSRFGLAVTLGGGEVRLIDLVTAYSSFANLGLKVEPIAILKVEDRDGKTLFEHRHVDGRKVLDNRVAFLINDVLSDNQARLLTFGSNSLLNMGNRDIAVKTGTTNDRRDNWAIGWSTNAIVGVWVGNNDNSPMTNVASGVSGASPIWRRIQLLMWEKSPGDSFDPPQGVDTIFVDSVSGYPEHDEFPSKSEYVIAGSLPPLPDPIHTKLKLCRDQKKLATLGQIASDNYEEKEFFIFKENDPFAGPDDPNQWQQGIDAWLETQADERYHPPTEECDGGEQAVVRVHLPNNERSYEGTEIEIDMSVLSHKSVERLEILANGSIRETLTDRPYRTTINLEAGRYEIQGRAVLEGGETITSGSVKIGTDGVSWKEADPTPSPTATPTASASATPKP